MPRMRIGELNQVIEDFSLNIRAFMQREDRASLKSMLFNVPKRTVLGSMCKTENAGAFLRDLTRAATPEEIGSRMRRPGSRLNAFHACGLLWSVLLAREQRRLEGRPDLDHHTVALVTDFTARLLRAYRGDGQCFPLPGSCEMPILRAEDVFRLLPHVERVDAPTLARLRAMVGTLTAYSFILHGEQRDGIYHHGPYPATAPRTLIVKELTDLADTALPWEPRDARLPVTGVVVAMVVENVCAQVDLWGTLMTEPADPYSRLRAAAVFGVSKEGLKRLDVADWSGLEARAQQATVRLYREVLGWDDRQKVAYGKDLAANHLRGFIEVAGADEGTWRRLVDGFEATTAAHLEEILRMDAVPGVWSRLASKAGSPFEALPEETA